MRALSILLASFLALAGCSYHRHQWVLESYDAQTGYVFSRAGARYEAQCYHVSAPVAHVDIGPYPPEGECSEVLPYLHKPVPLDQIGDDILTFRMTTGSIDWSYEFEIVKAK